MMRPKSPARERVEAQTKLRELTQRLELDLLRREVQIQLEPSPAHRLKIALALAVLVGAIGLAVLPAVGTGWLLFYFSLSLYLWQALVGLSVLLGIAAAIWALWVLFIRR